MKGAVISMKPLSVLLVGAGGYAANYVREMLDHGEERALRLAGVVDPYAATLPSYAELKQRGARFFGTVNQFYDLNSADLAVIATPIQYHAPQAVACLAHGSHVLCEKPAAATPEDVERMIAARDASGRALAIGFQWCYDEAMLRLKADVDAGALGRPVALRSIVLWPRAISYYKRGMGWAGRKYDAAGAPIFDSVASNATAHYLENMLWLVGAGYNGADITGMTVRTMRANDIETFDTIVMDAVLENGAKALFVASHAVGEDGRQEPAFVYEFENATVRFGGIGENGSNILARFRDGSVKDYGLTNLGGVASKLDRVCAIARGEPLPLPCPAEAALRHTRAMAMIREKQPEADVFPESAVRVDDGLVWVPGLRDRLVKCYENWETL